MKITDAALIDLENYNQTVQFADICRFAELNDICSTISFVSDSNSPYFGYEVCSLVKMADDANLRQKKVWENASLEFILNFICCFIPYTLFNDAALTLLKKYNIDMAKKNSEHVPIDEKMAMAAILMISIGYELQKQVIIKQQIKAHVTKLKNIPPTQQPKEVWRIASSAEYEAYHLDVIIKKDNAPIVGLQFERKRAYFELLTYQKDSSGKSLPNSYKLKLDRNRQQSNLFLDRFPDAQIELFIYKPNSNTPLIIYQKYDKVEALGLSDNKTNIDKQKEK